jgi:hypothetical protein
MEKPTVVPLTLDEICYRERERIRSLVRMKRTSNAAVKRY